MADRKVPNVMRSRPKVSFHNLMNEKPSEMMKTCGLSERGFQQEWNRHCFDAKPSEKEAFIKQIYDGKK